jgi:hypothetical protein
VLWQSFLVFRQVHLTEAGPNTGQIGLRILKVSGVARACRPAASQRSVAPPQFAAEPVHPGPADQFIAILAFKPFHAQRSDIRSFDDPSREQNCQAVTQNGDTRKIMRDEHKGQALFLAQRLERFQELGLYAGIQYACRRARTKKWMRPFETAFLLTELSQSGSSLSPLAAAST